MKKTVIPQSMHVAHYGDVETLLADADGFLKQREDTNNFLYSVLTMGPHGLAKPVPAEFLTAIKDGEEFRLVAVQRTTVELAISATNGEVTDDDLLTLAREWVKWHS